VTFGQGFYSEIDGLQLKVEVRDGGWYYAVLNTKGGTAPVNWTPGPAPSTVPYQEPEDVKFEALTTAMALLGRSDDPHAVFQALKWRAYGPGH